MPLQLGFRAAGLGRTALGRTALGMLIVGLGTCAPVLWADWRYRVDGPSPARSFDVLVVLAILVAVGAAVGLTSGSFRAAPASWVVAVIALVAAYWIFYVLLFPGSPYPGEDGFEGDLAVQAPFLFPVIVGGHVLGVVANRALRPAFARA
jgi:hypothetical protein